jgi:nucleoside-diphosphate-sugar epimerase
MPKKILVTGGCGFIGSNLVNFVSKNFDWKIDVVDNLIKGRYAFIDQNSRNNNLKIVIDDFSSPNIIKHIRNQEYDYVFHLAANPSVEFSVLNPLKSNDENVSKTLILMDSCKGNIEKFIFSSSSAIYGNVEHLPTREDSTKNPRSPYGLQKYLIEQYLELYKFLYSFKYVSLRYFNVFGKNQLGDSPYSTVVSAWLHKIKNNLPLRVDGDGNQTRDMCYVEDVVQANILAAISDISGDSFNIGNGRSVSNNYILDLLSQKFNINKNNSQERIGDVKHTLADISKSKSLLNFFPKWQFEKALEETIEWSQKSDIF